MHTTFATIALSRQPLDRAVKGTSRTVRVKPEDRVLDDSREALAGVAVTTVTQFRDDGTVDRGQTAERAAWLAANGIGLLIPSGNTGEYHSLTRGAWSDNLTATLEGARQTSLVMPGVGGALHDVIAMTREAADAGAAGVMVLPLHHTFTSVAGIRDYLHQVLEASEIGVVAYIRNPSHLDPVVEALGIPT